RAGPREPPKTPRKSIYASPVPKVIITRMCWLNCALQMINLWLSTSCVGSKSVGDFCWLATTSPRARREYLVWRCEVRLGHKADMAIALSDVRFWGYSGHRASTLQCPLLTPKRTSAITRDPLPARRFQWLIF